MPSLLATILISLALLFNFGVNGYTLQPRDATQSFEDVFKSPGSNSYAWEADSITYNITLQVDPNCPSSVNASTKAGPYVNSRGERIEEATLGDITNDLKNLPATKVRSITRRNLAEAYTSLKSRLSDTILCDDQDGQYDIQVHDELRRKLLAIDYNKITYYTLSSIYGFFIGGAIEFLGKYYSNDDPDATSAEILIASFMGFAFVTISSMTMEFVQNPRLANNPTVIFNSIAASFMRLVNLVMRRGGNNAGGNIAGGVGGGGDVEMGNGGLASQGVGLGGGSGGSSSNSMGGGRRVKGRDGGFKCVKKEDATKGLLGLAGLKNDYLGLVSQDALTHQGGSCPVSF